MKKIILTSITLILLFSCKKGKEINPYCEHFAAGEVIVGIKPNVEIEQLFTYINTLGLHIDAVRTLFTTTIGKDSIEYIRNILNTKPYINARQFRASVWAHYQTNVVHITNYFWDMTKSNQQDFIQTKILLKMSEDLSGTKVMRVKVPQGQEIFWMGIFKNFSWVDWSELNCISDIRLFN